MFAPTHRFDISSLPRARYDPLADVPLEIESEQDRVVFIRTITQIIVSSDRQVWQRTAHGPCFRRRKRI